MLIDNKFVPLWLPLQPLRKVLNQAMTKMDALFSRMYEANPQGGRLSVPPDKLLYAMLLKMHHSVRSERQLMEQVQYNMLFRCFFGLSMVTTRPNSSGSAMKQRSYPVYEHDLRWWQVCKARPVGHAAHSCTQGV